MDKARKTFQNTGIEISKREEVSRRSVGVPPFHQQVIRVNVHDWAEEIHRLSDFATSQPHTAYAAFTHGLSSKWLYLLRITDWEAISDTDLHSIETAIRQWRSPRIKFTWGTPGANL